MTSTRAQPPEVSVRTIGRATEVCRRVAHALEHKPQPPPLRPRADVPPSPRSWSYVEPHIRLAHLAERFFMSLRPGAPSLAGRTWVAAVLSPAELALFRRLPNADQRHAIGVAKVAEALTHDRRVARAGLLHDIGKVDCRLSTVERSIAIAMKRAFPVTTDLWCREWWERVRSTPDGRLRPKGTKQKFASYWMHPWQGRMMLERAGGDPVAAAWALQHHHPFIAEDLVLGWDAACVLWYTDGD